MQKDILIIDDDITICEILDTLLKDEGYNTKPLHSGDNLDTTLKTFHPDLIILDYLLPGKNGAELTKHLRRKSSTKNTPIIMIAANSHYKTAAKNSGVNLFLNKPFDIYELMYGVNSLLMEPQFIS